MDLNRILNELKQEHELVQDTIVSLERPARGAGRLVAQENADAVRQPG